MTGSAALGLLLAMMEPPPTVEEEFQHWYDTEHFPERVETEGFLTAARAVCIDGWPRYLALYDLTNVQVLHGPEYAKIAGDNYTVWTDRVVSRAWGQYRAEGVQIYPGTARLGDKGTGSRLVIWRFRHAPPAAVDDVVSGLRELYEGKPETAQVRVFESPQGAATDYLGLVELHAPLTIAAGAAHALQSALPYLDMVNTYTRYQRRWSSEAPEHD
jgi:hypothetical protein